MQAHFSERIVLAEALPQEADQELCGREHQDVVGCAQNIPVRPYISIVKEQIPILMPFVRGVRNEETLDLTASSGDLSVKRQALRNVGPNTHNGKAIRWWFSG